jgi:predicted ArsR family transcriptional regulator
VKEILKLLKKRPKTGWTIPEIADALGVARTTVRYRLSRLCDAGLAAAVPGKRCGGRGRPPHIWRAVQQ